MAVGNPDEPRFSEEGLAKLRDLRRRVEQGDNPEFSIGLSPMLAEPIV